MLGQDAVRDFRDFKQQKRVAQGESEEFNLLVGLL